MSRLDKLEAKARQATVTDPRSLAIYRILFGAWMLLFFRSTTWLTEIPPTFFDPPFISLANLFGRFPPKGFFVGLDALNVLFAIMVTIGLRTRFSSIALLFVKLVRASFLFSLGKIDHGILVPCALFAMSFSNWGAVWSVDNLLRRKPPKLRTAGNGTALLGVLIAFGFLSAGFGKALVWLDFNTSTGGFLAWLHVGYYTVGRTLLLAPWASTCPGPGFMSWWILPLSFLNLGSSGRFSTGADGSYGSCYGPAFTW